MPVGSVDPEIQELGRQEEGAGNGGGWRGWMQEVKLKVQQEADGVLPLSSLSPHFQRLDQIDRNKQRPSIFMPFSRRLAPPVPMVRMVPQTASQDHTGAAARSRGSTRGNIIVAAIGPYHHHHLSESQPPLITRAKKSAIVEFLARREFGLDTDAFLRWALGNDATARRFYERHSVTMGPIEFAEMHLLDGCLVLFAIFLLRSGARDENQRSTTLGEELGKQFTYLSTDISLHMKETRLDLLLLGNQIPFFVIEHLYDRLKGTFFKGIRHTIQELALSCFDDIRPTRSGLVIQDREALVFHHLLHLFHRSRVPPGKHAMDPSSPLLGDPESNIPCATWFEDSHISLSKDAAGPGTLDIVFERNMLGARGVLHVPALHIHGYSELIFHNLIAFEQGHLRCGLAVTTYSICMARLLQSEADAKLLRKSGILAHTHETDKEIVDLFRRLAVDEFRRDAFYSKDLLDLCKDIETHRQSTPARFVKWIKVQCFPKQTVTFFVILGALISVATLLNTIYSLIRYYHPAKH